MRRFQGVSHLKALSQGRWDRIRAQALRLNEQLHWMDLGLCWGAALLLILMLRPFGSGSDLPLWREGERATRTVNAPEAGEFEDSRATEEGRQTLLSRIPPVYDFDAEAVANVISQWRAGIKALRLTRDLDTAAKAQQLSEKLGLHVSLEEARALGEVLHFSTDLERSIAFAFGPLWDQKIIDNRNAISAPNFEGLEVFDVQAQRSHFLRPAELTSLMSLEEARSLVARAATAAANSPRTRTELSRSPWIGWKPQVRDAVFGLQARLVRANLTLNRKETESRRHAALKNFRPYTLRVKKGEVLVREGEKVSAQAARLLDEFSRGGAEAARLARGRLLREALFGGICLWLLLLFLRKQFPRVLVSNKNTLVASVWLLLSLASFKLTLIFELNVVAEYFSSIPPSFFLFLIPIAAPAMILRLLVQSPLAIVFSALYGLGVALILGSGAAFGLHATLSCLLGAYFLTRARTRSSLYVAGLKTAAVGSLLAVTLTLAWGGQLPFAESDTLHPWLRILTWTWLGGAVGGWLSSALTLVVTPLLEGVLDYTTDLKLLELARMDHPLLRDLVMKAPGTYHHSIIVGSLVEAACEAIGANALLARVGSYYHDIGKLVRPEYFVENQPPGRNPHENTKPGLSAKIIISHVKEGVTMAQQHKLGQKIIDFIEQHHGTGLVSFFYNKAKQEAAQPSDGSTPCEVNEDDFRYPGPKPRSKEAAIMALADSCEAATRSLIEPTPARIEGMVKKIIAKAFAEGLLDEADVTLREVNLAGNAFVRILLGIHHNRIQYPDQEKGLPSRVIPLSKTRY